MHFRIEFESSVLYSEKPELHRFKADHLTPALIKVETKLSFIYLFNEKKKKNKEISTSHIR